VRREKGMKRNVYIVVVMMLGGMILLTAGISHAGGWMHQSSGETKKMEIGSNTPALEPWSQEYWQAVETGILPGAGVTSDSPESDRALVRGAESEPKEQIGAFEYRQIDKGE
jgi:hypothetical protein